MVDGCSSSITDSRMLKCIVQGAKVGGGVATPHPEFLNALPLLRVPVKSAIFYGGGGG